jgi:wyosine [tRNA(Phe)-imidazoG37] synthetase (radical SAM superfamily)
MTVTINSPDPANHQLSINNHDRDAVNMTYVYPVISRRAGGVSIGINLNPNNACNWRCAYCQVPNLVRGVAPEIDLACLRSELQVMLDNILHGDFMAQRVPEDCRRLCDVAISGNGEPTSCRSFDAVVAVISELMGNSGLSVPLRLITNGSYIHKPHVQAGLRKMSSNNGEVWIKVDSVTDEGIRRINGIKLDEARLRQQVETSANHCPTWLQTCMVAWDGQPPAAEEVSAYLQFLTSLKQEHVPVRGVMLYGLARPSLQQEAAHLTALDSEWMEDMAVRIRQCGFDATLSV